MIGASLWGNNILNGADGFRNGGTEYCYLVAQQKTPRADSDAGISYDRTLNVRLKCPNGLYSVFI